MNVVLPGHIAINVFFCVSFGDLVSHDIWLLYSLAILQLMYFVCLFPLVTWKLGSSIVVFLVHIEIHVFCVFLSLGGKGSYDC